MSENLPAAFFRHFNRLCADAFADGWSALALREDELRRSVAALGGPYFAGLRELYAQELKNRAETVVRAVKQAHADFGSPLGPGVGERLAALASDMFAAQPKGLQAAYGRHIGRIGAASLPEAVRPVISEQDQALYAASVPNRVRRYVQELTEVPSKRPSPSPPAGVNGSSTVTIGTVYGAVVTGAHASATVQQQWNQDAAAGLADALQLLRAAILAAPDLPQADKQVLVQDVQQAQAEMKSETPATGKVLRWLGGVGAVVQTLGSTKEAWEAVRTAAKSMGVPLP